MGPWYQALKFFANLEGAKWSLIVAFLCIFLPINGVSFFAYWPFGFLFLSEAPLRAADHISLNLGVVADLGQLGSWGEPRSEGGDDLKSRVEQGRGLAAVAETGWELPSPGAYSWSHALVLWQQNVYLSPTLSLSELGKKSLGSEGYLVRLGRGCSVENQQTYDSSQFLHSEVFSELTIGREKLKIWFFYMNFSIFFLTLAAHYKK